MEKLSKGMIVDGVFSSESLDTSGEILRVKGCDISDLENGTGILNFEHKGDNPGDVLGKIIYAKKIFSEKDCDDERQLAYYRKVGLPMIYGQAELFDGEAHPGAVAAAAIIRYYHNRNEPLLARFSIEGTTLERDGTVLKRSFARRVALTLKPCNRACYSGVILDDMGKSEKEDKDLFHGNYYETDIVFDDPLEKSGSDSELEHIEKAFKREPKSIYLDHYSNHQDLNEIHPKYHGTGYSGQERSERKANQGKDYVDRSYFYESGTKPEATLASRTKYTVKLPDDAKIYDLANDTEGYAQKAMEVLPYPVFNKEHRTWIENKLKEDGYFGYKHSGSSVSNAVAVFHPLKTEKNKKTELEKTLTLGGYGGAPSSRTGGAALQTEQWIDGKDRRQSPEEFKKTKAQVMAAFRDWDRVTPIRKFLKNRLPEASDRYIDRFVGVVDDYQVKKAEELFGNLYKASKIGNSMALFKSLEKQKSFGKTESYLMELNTGEELQLDILEKTIKIHGGEVFPEDRLEGFFDLIKSGEITLKKKIKELTSKGRHRINVRIESSDELASLHSDSFQTLSSLLERSLDLLSSKHGGKRIDSKKGKYGFTFESEERANGFAKDVQQIQSNLRSQDHEHTVALTVENKNQPLEKAFRYNPEIPDFDISVLKNLFSNHIQAHSYWKMREKDLSELPDNASPKNIERATQIIDKSKSSVDHTKKMLHNYMGKFFTKDPSEQESLKGHLMEEYFKEQKLGKAEGTKMSGEYHFKDLPDLEHHLSNKDFALISPHSSDLPHEENKQRNTAFLEDLKRGGYSYTSLMGRFTGNDEASYLVHNIPTENATSLARKYNQFSHIQSSGGKHKYHVHREHGYNPPGHEGHQIGEFDDNYSVAKFSGGGSAKFKVNLEPPTNKKSEDQDELIEEHKRLVQVLRSPSHKDDKKEAKRQEAELRRLLEGKGYTPEPVKKFDFSEFMGIKK